MIIDEQTLNIIFRAGKSFAPNRESESEKNIFIELYMNLLFQTIFNTGAEEFGDMPNSQEDLAKLSQKISDKIMQQPESDFTNKVNDELNKINKMLIEFFIENASYGDMLYLEVYLLSKINNLKNIVGETPTKLSKESKIELLPQKSQPVSLNNYSSLQKFIQEYKSPQSKLMAIKDFSSKP